jgi:hypothetical protein
MMLDHLDTRYGSAEKYLWASGLSSIETEQLKNRLRLWAHVGNGTFPRSED